jgi:hypothetical protein
MKKKDSTKIFWYLVAIGFALLFILILVSSVLDVGERLRNIHAYVEYAFYGIAVILIYTLILRPIHIIFFSPSFSVETTIENQKKINMPLYRRVAKRLIDGGMLPDEEVDQLKLSMRDATLLQERLHHAFTFHVKKKMNTVIKKHAKTVMVSTAISQNGRLDFFTVVVVNLKMIKELVVMCGFRPSFKNLAKLTINVFTTALIAEGLENLDINEVLPTSTINSLGEIPFAKPMLSSITQGISNGLLTLRIGIVTRKYLFSDANEITKEQIRRTALLEAAKMVPGVIADAFVSFPKRITNLFKKPETETEN